MKIFVTQGHELGIGLEVFFKSCVLLNPSELNLITLLAFPDSVKRTLNTLGIPYRLSNDKIHLGGNTLNIEWLSRVDHSESFSSLRRGMDLAEKEGLLYTLPTSKDQFPGFAGHTEFFRSFYNSSELGMFFSSPNLQILLLSDHIPLSEVSTTLTTELIEARLDLALKSLKQMRWPINKVLISGFNPHAGENGLIGKEDDRVSNALKRLRVKYQFDMSGPRPGDTMLLEKNDPCDLLVYLFHDQGLGVFKGLQGFIGSNITLGLKYPRFSPDHGTSFHLFGKNKADYRGCIYSLREAIHGKNSSHKS
ncbi:MAG: 4-hydroxythreonine-4-phosphate dehydrogenase PdxA [Candidatus Caenarcaniphilales bacterium]|nr:4-hydroxythreonine-4-phosphate dehydrogenase PdxA [Candidatus Caenarcaniphilales bacterium]